MNLGFLSTIAMIAPDPSASRELYVGALGLPLSGEAGDYQHSEQIAGCRSFGIWPLSQAAEACFYPRQPRRASAPESGQVERPTPQVSIEFDVEEATAVAPAVEELQQAGYAVCRGHRELGRTRLRPHRLDSRGRR